MTGLSVLRALLSVFAFSGISLATLKNEVQTRQNADPCADIANETYVVPSKVFACLKSVPLFDPLTSLFTSALAPSHSTQPCVIT
jgi:hypothetical protein